MNFYKFDFFLLAIHYMFKKTYFCYQETVYDNKTLQCW